MEYSAARIDQGSVGLASYRDHLGNRLQAQDQVTLGDSAMAWCKDTSKYNYSYILNNISGNYDCDKVGTFNLKGRKDRGGSGEGE